MSKFLDKFDGVEVINARHDGYRRAGFVLKKGRNELPVVDYKTLQALEADPFLTVNIIGESYVKNNTDIVSATGADKATAVQNSTDIKNADVPPPPVIPSFLNPVIPPSDAGAETPPQQTRAERLQTTANNALLATDPTIYFNQDGSPSVTKWKALLNDNSLTKEEVTAAIEVAKAAQKTE